MFRYIALCLCAAGVMLGQEMFLSLEGIRGDSTASNFKDQIVILGFTYESDPGRIRSSGMNSITFYKRFDVASPQLLRAAAMGTHVRNATFTLVTNEGEALRPYAVVTLGPDVIVTAVRIEKTATASAPPVESITLAFERAEWCYTTFDPSGVQTGRRCESFGSR